MSFLLLSMPIFAVVALGWAAVKMEFVPVGGTDALGAFSFRFALPALVLQLIAGGPLGQSFNPRFFAGYLASGSLVFALMFVITRLLQRRGAATAGARATTSTVSNLGFLGPPIVLAFFGARGAGPLAIAIVCEVMILMSVGAVIMAGADKAAAAGSLILRSAAYNPVIAAILAGAAIAASGLVLPKPLNDFLSFLGASAAPTALFAVGGCTRNSAHRSQDRLCGGQGLPCHRGCHHSRCTPDSADFCNARSCRPWAMCGHWATGQSTRMKKHGRRRTFDLYKSARIHGLSICIAGNPLGQRKWTDCIG